MLPAILRADSDTAVLADRFSCRTPIDQLDSNGRHATHMAERLAAALESTSA